MDNSVYHDKGEYERAVRYSRVKEWMVLAGTLWTAAFNLALLATGLSAILRSWSERLAPRRLGPAMPYAVASALLTFLTELPLSYLSGWEIEHRFGLSNQSRAAWLLEQLKGLGVSILLAAPLTQIVLWIFRRAPRRWWLILSALTVPFSVVAGALAPVLIMPLFNKFQPVRDKELEGRIRALAANQGVTVSDVLEMDMSKQTNKANAMFTGLGKTRRIVLGDTLLNYFTPEEVEVVLAHELGHQVHRDIWKLILLSAPTSLLGLLTVHLLAPRVLQRYGHAWRVHEVSDVAALPLLSLIGGAAILLISPLLNAISRRYVEHPADRYALDLTQNREAFISAMEKLARMNLSNPSPSVLVKILLYSHPPISERIAFARAYNRGAE